MSETSSDDEYGGQLHGSAKLAENSSPAASLGVDRAGKDSSLDNASKSTFSYSSASIASSVRQQQLHVSLRSMSDTPHQTSLAQHPPKGSHISASSVPTHEDLYERRRHRLSKHQSNLLTKATHNGKEAKQECAPSHTRGLQCSPRNEEDITAVRSQARVETDPVENTEYVEVSEDALLKRMQKKEKQFDAKIKEINQTFSSAGRQLVLRDDIIEALHREILELREQLDRHSVGNHQSREGEKRLMESIQSNTHKLQIAESNSKLERERLRAELDQCESRCAMQRAQIEQLRGELEESHRAARESKQHHTKEIEKLRKNFHNQLSEISVQYSKMDREHANMQEKVQQAEQTQRHTQAEVLQAQFELRQYRDQEGETVKSLLQEQNRLQEEVEASRLSIARLLSVLSCVPDMRNYLKWNEIDSEFVFLAYPTQYFRMNDKSSFQTTRDTKLANSRTPRNHDSVDKDEDNYARDYEINAAGQPLNIETNPQTGVEDGIYTGSASFQKTKNIWLNGQWIKKLQEIVDSENMFTRLKKIKLLELEEAARLCNQLPTAQDVLQCRRQERDYWVPYKVLMVAQQFKNKYCPRVPALSHFYPFLMNLNAIWNRKLQERLCVLRKELQAAQQHALLQLKNKQQPSQNALSLPIAERYHCRTPHNGVAETEVFRDHLDEGAHGPRQQSGRTPRQVHCRALVLGTSRNLSSIYNEHIRLRREVRLHITSQRSLALFRQYDQLVKFAGSTIQQLVRLCEQTGREEMIGRQRHAHVDDDSCESTPSDESSIGDVPALPTPPRGRQEYRSEHSRHGAKGRSKIAVNSTGRPKEMEEMELGNRTIASDATNIMTLEREVIEKDAAIQHLVCMVQGTCKRVGDITQALFARTMACCADLEKLMRMVQYKYIPKLYSREGKSEEWTTEAQQRKAAFLRTTLLKNEKKTARGLSAYTASSHSSSSSPEATPVNKGVMRGPVPRGLSTQNIQQPFPSVLSSQYAKNSVAARLLKKYGPITEKGMDLRGCGNARPPSGGPRGVEALSQVVASVLDFTSEVKSEMQNASDALETVLNRTISESGVCQCEG
ncbi:unnamed protein product [Phytomonas sp. EM1]|nr:unnamed protein product [Phytomonas sp. EM1]|eukprot:CCW60517.1 unnamed protein product [Phytomonas sp. isolate EM1]